MKPDTLRQRIWRFARRNHPEGQILTRWLRIVRAVLYPLDTFYWAYSQKHGYNWYTDIWTINGIRYSGAAMRQLAIAKGETYRITAREGVITLERVQLQIEYAGRYSWLRDRPLSTIDEGGVFAGITPHNLVLSGDDLDEAIDRAMKSEARP